MTPARPRPGTPTGAALTVVALGCPQPLVAGVRTRLALSPVAMPLTITDAALLPPGAHADIVVCSVADGAVAAQRWPDATVIALVGAGEDTRACVEALETGLHVCVTGADPGLVAAYVQAVARRRVRRALPVAEVG